MPIKDVLLVLTTYPVPTPVWAIDGAVALAVALDARISAIACEVTHRVPRSILGDTVINISAIVAAEHAKSAANANSLLNAFQESATRHRIFQERILEKCQSSEVPAVLTEHARLRDLTIMPMPEEDVFSNSSANWYAQSIIFDSGRPMIILPQEQKRMTSLALDTVAVAWDSSRPAARAIADALPILKAAKTVRIVTVVNDKAIGSKHSSADLAKHLALHGIDAVVDVADAAGRDIGKVLKAYVAPHGVDLLVMGAYGHSRIRELILGGATKSVLAHPPTSVFLSH